MSRLIAIAAGGALLASLAGCAAPPSATTDLRAGMTRHQVIVLMGTPDFSVADPGKECSYYNLHRSIWSGPAGIAPDRYAVCFGDGAVTSFGLERGPWTAAYPPPPELPPL